MNFEEDYNAGQMGQDDDFMWQDDETIESAGPNNRFSNYNNRGGFRRGIGYGMNGPPQFFGFRGPPVRAGPPFMWGRGFGPAGPPIQHQGYSGDIKPIRYLMRCGIPRQHLKGLPRPLLSLMEPGFCGVCSQELVNFTESRIHYISKNHLKIQKKWLAQQNRLGPNPSGELPLKSRDLYCELCDVQITSKNHADLHYAGKLHRAVVEGRRNPKNPFLLQRGMEARVWKLIRREKKHVKLVQESDANEEVKKESKPMQPELFCGICQTSVTCSEQMTMHLNGKRHLTKEKQHILKMMKGEAGKNNDNPARSNDAQAENAADQGAEDVGATDKDNQNDDGANDDGANDDGANGDGANGDGANDDGANDDGANDDGANDDGTQDDYDWGNGSGTWDDDPQ